MWLGTMVPKATQDVARHGGAEGNTKLALDDDGVPKASLASNDDGVPKGISEVEWRPGAEGIARA
ncbi:unnamed protein product [Prunus armeniaca]